MLSFDEFRAIQNRRRVGSDGKSLKKEIKKNSAYSKAQNSFPHLGDLNQA